MPKNSGYAAKKVTPKRKKQKKKKGYKK